MASKVLPALEPVHSKVGEGAVVSLEVPWKKVEGMVVFVRMETGVSALTK